MPNDRAIAAQALTKSYRIWDRPSSRLLSPLLEGLAHCLPKSNPVGARLETRAQRHYRDFFALKDVSFEIMRGESVGIIGRNGAGKSTLLQLIAGTLYPSSGTLEVNGSVAALLELGSGFNPDFTGRENVYLNAAILGMSPAAIDTHFEDIVAFADIGDFIDEPVKIYSSGMQMRLAFAVQTAINPDILIVDEALSVGDSLFQAKCMARMKRMLERGLTLIFVTHSVDLVPQICRSAFYLEAGRLKSAGAATPTVDLYLRDIRASQYAARRAASGKDNGRETDDALATARPGVRQVPFQIDHGFDARVASFRYGTGGARIRCLELLGSDGQPTSAFGFREKIIVRAHIESSQALDALNCCLLIRNRQGVEIMHCTSFESAHKLPFVPAHGRIVVDIAFENVLKPGQGYSVHYTINNTYSLENQEIMDLIEIAAAFDVRVDPGNPIHYLVWHPFEFSVPPVAKE